MDQVKRTPAEIRNNFNAIVKQFRALKQYSGKPAYYDKCDTATIELKKFIRQDFSFLTSHQLLQLCALVSTYRPVEPFSFLVSCSMLLAPDYQNKNKITTL